jgi:hypothetical protein
LLVGLKTRAWFRAAHTAQVDCDYTNADGTIANCPIEPPAVVTPSGTEHFSSSVRRLAAAKDRSEPGRHHAKDLAAELAPKSGIAGADRVFARKAPGTAPNMVDPERAFGFPNPATIECLD